MLLANYASDSGSESESEASTVFKAAPAPASLAKASGSSSATIAKGKKRGPIKITLDLPKTGNEDDDQEEEGGAKRSDEGDGDESRDAKRPKLPKGGKGSSLLLGMLPPPKRRLPTTGSTSKSSSLAVNKSMATSSSSSNSKSSRPVVAPFGETGVTDDDEDEDDEDGGKQRLLPPSLARSQAKKRQEEELDLFGLSTTAAAPTVPSIPSTSVKPPSISSAPLAPDYIPPPPSSTDPYPGYYQLPSGQWSAYDPDYYHSFFAKQRQDEEAMDDGRVGKHWDDFESGQFGGNVLDIDASKGLEEARREEERKSLTKKPTLPGDEFEYKPTGQVKGLAAQRHQLSSLLNTAYTQKEELEQRIAANKKSMRAAGQKYAIETLSRSDGLSML
ncbi:hypothetical protein IAR55_006572 [Kwoniella newhampshirensis]|uniref:Mitotic checkpoint regulator, MAD2B-interacting-domain-containing protein n=1 Tax=Kwoniella newhampshirensis TaxID=1651941 RepID=A0AAW0YTF8_9TREE